MQRHLSQLASELRKETCPQRVLDEVERRISQEKSAPVRLRWAVLWVVAGFVLVACLSVWLWAGKENARRGAALVEHPKLDHAQMARQAENALALVGSELLDASAHSQKIISDRAVPPLRNSIETAKNKMTPRIAL